MRPFFGRSKMSRVLSARARARARAPGPRVALGPPALLTIGDYDQRLFARAQLSKNELKILFNWSFRFFYYIKVDFWPAHPFLVSALALCKKKADTKKLIQKFSHITGYISYLLFGGLRTGNFFILPNSIVEVSFSLSKSVFHHRVLLHHAGLHLST